MWSLFSGLTGFTHSFETMFLCRLMVGVGKATLGPAALSLLSDYFPARMRASVTAVYSSAIAVGSGLALALGGQLEALLVCPAASVLAALLLWPGSRRLERGE